MIRISNISKSFFPEIDFKFRNSGQSAAVLSEFTLRVLDARVDRTPVLAFHYRIAQRAFVRPGDQRGAWEGDNSLELIAQNNGWGPALDCECVFGEHSIDKLFASDERRLVSNIDSLGTSTLRLDPHSIDPKHFARVRSALLEIARIEMEKSLPEFLEWNKDMTKENGYEDGALERDFLDHQKETRLLFGKSWGCEDNMKPQIPLNNPEVTWTCRDVAGNQLSGSSKVEWPEDCGGKLYLTSEGFLFHPTDACACASWSDRTYCVLIDPDLGRHTRTYSISRQIPAGGTDRFHIRVGGKKSCELRLQFEFTVDTQQRIRSKPFLLTIFHPAGSWNHGFDDGDELLREHSEYSQKLKTENDDDGLRRSLRGIGKEDIRNFPLLPPEKPHD